MVDAAVVAVAAAAFFVLYKCTEQRKNEKTDFWREFSGSFGLFFNPRRPRALGGRFFSQDQQIYDLIFELPSHQIWYISIAGILRVAQV